MSTFPVPHPGRTLADLAAHVAAFFISRREAVRHPDWEIAEYSTQTFRRNTNGVLELVAETPEITFGDLRGR
jgi:hypothetical protein